MHWELFKQAKLSEGVLPYTLNKYFISLRLLNDWLFLEDATPSKAALQRYLAHRMNKVSAFRVRNDWVAMMSFYSWAEKEKIVIPNPMIDIKAPKLPKGIINIYSDHETTSILEAAKDTILETIITVFLKTGIRGKELLKIQCRDVDMQQRTIHIHGKGAKDRRVPFDGNCASSLSSYLNGNPSNPVFETRIKNIRASLKEICETVEIPYRPPHCFRHTFACNYLKNGGSPLSLKRILGHSTLAMVDHYTQWLADNQAIDEYHKIYA